MFTMTMPVARSYRFNLGMLPEEVNKISDHFYYDSDTISVYKENGSVYAEFYAATEKEIDRNIEEACYIILDCYPHLDVSGGSFEE